MHGGVRIPAWNGERAALANGDDYRVFFLSTAERETAMPLEFEKVQGNVVIVIASGRLTDDDYKATFIPMMEGLFKTWGHLRMLFVMAEGFDGWDLHGAWDEFRFELKHKKDVVKVGVVGDAKWEKWATRLSKMFTGANVRFFEPEQQDSAREWITSGFE